VPALLLVANVRPMSRTAQRRRVHRRLLPVAAALALVGPLVGVAAGGPTAPRGSLISQDRPATASSTQGRSTPPGAVDDADLTSRWSSLASDPQWVQIDLGGPAAISRVRVSWERAYASRYALQTSTDQVHWRTAWSTRTGTGGVTDVRVTAAGRYLRLLGTRRATPYGYSVDELQVYGTVTRPAGRSVPAQPPVTGVRPSSGHPTPTGFHEFQARCGATHDRMDDPIAFPGQAGASHQHTFLGNTTTDARPTLASLQAGSTACLAPGDRSAYWAPTLYDGSRAVDPVGPQVIYYKSGVRDYPNVRPFPLGLRFVVGNPKTTSEQLLAASVEGWECGTSYGNADFPKSCPAGTELNIRYQAPSCWDGRHLDVPDHQSHMAYPVDGRCTAAHPVALPMIEVKLAYPVSGDLRRLHLSSGRGYSFHYDFFDAWDPATLAALVTHCIDGGLQCDARGYDQTQPAKGAALGADYRLP